jgi:glycosyltransferase involved in cell wall biosynthesis
LKVGNLRGGDILNLCLCTDLWLGENSGAVDRITSFAQSLSQNGINVCLVDRKSKRSLSTLLLNQDTYYEVKNGITKRRSYPLHILLFFPGLINLVQDGLNKLFCLFTRTPESEVTLFRAIDPYLLMKLLFVCKKEQIDLIQCEFPPTTVFTSFILKKLLNIPLVFDAHNIESERMRGSAKLRPLYASITKQMEMTICRICDSIFVVSENDKEKLLNWNISSNRIEVIPNSVDLHKFSSTVQGTGVRNKYNLNNDIVIIFHGALGYSPNKEAVNIIEKNIFPQIQKYYPSAHLLLVGSDPPEGLPPYFVVTGYVENLPEYIAAADLAIVPLLRGGGTRIKILEYMACGKAIVSTVKGAEGLNLQNGVDIFITEYPDSKFVDSVLKLIADSSLRRSMGINARKKAELLYDWLKTAEKAVEIYNKLFCVLNEERHADGKP